MKMIEDAALVGRIISLLCIAVIVAGAIWVARNEEE